MQSKFCDGSLEKPQLKKDNAPNPPFQDRPGGAPPLPRNVSVACLAIPTRNGFPCAGPQYRMTLTGPEAPRPWREWYRKLPGPWRRAKGLDQEEGDEMIPLANPRGETP